MKPTEKITEIDDFIKEVFGIDRIKIIENNNCVFCVDPNFNFRDTKCVQEYRISGICQNCQDDVFGKDD